MKRNYYPPLEPGVSYHIYNRANSNNDILFETDANFRYFLKLYSIYIAPFVHTYAFCLLPNHFHFLVKMKSHEELSKIFGHHPDINASLINKLLSNQFRKWFISYGKAFNIQKNRRGSLFQKGFKRLEIHDLDYFKMVIAYIHLNPVKHLYQLDYTTYPYSSYKYILRRSLPYLDKKSLMTLFGDIPHFVSFHQSFINDKIFYKSVKKEETVEFLMTR